MLIDGQRFAEPFARFSAMLFGYDSSYKATLLFNTDYMGTVYYI